MSNMSLREQVAGERRRLKAVRSALSQALERGARGDAAFVPFYIAEGDYLEAAMQRLDDQDVRMGELILKRLGAPPDTAQQAALDEIEARLHINRQHLRELLAARDALRAEGVPALERFEKVGQAYSDFITATMGHHGPVTELAQRLFSLDDWGHMAGITEAETRRERELYDGVLASLPAGVEVPPVA